MPSPGKAVLAWFAVGTFAGDGSVADVVGWAADERFGDNVRS